MAERDYLAAVRDHVVVFDGSMGALLEDKNLSLEKDYQLPGRAHEVLVLNRPDVIEELHTTMLDAGAMVLETDSFQASRLKLEEWGLADHTLEINRRAAEIARKAAGNHRFVAGSIGPTGFLPSSDDPTLGNILFPDLVTVFEEQARGLIEGGSDLLIIETAQDILEVKAAIFGAREAFKATGRKVPLQISVSLLPNGGKMLLGTDVASVVTTLEALKVDVIGLNCSTGPEDMRDAIRYLGENASVPVHCIPNAGIPQQGVNGETVFPEKPQPLADALGEFVDQYGVAVVGGCCGTTPEHISAIAERVAKKPAGATAHAVGTTRERRIQVSSMIGAADLVQEPRPTIVGERVNSQGSRKAKELLLADDYDALVTIAEGQVEGGAHVLDVCVALTERQDEAEQMRQVVKKISLTQPAPIQIDSTEPDVIKVALEQIPGRAIVNSVNLEAGRDKMDQVVPLALQHGAAVIALTIDEVGMGKTTERKLEIAERITQVACDEHGLEREALIFDLLTFTLTTGDEEWRDSAIQTIEAIRQIKDRIPGVKTSLGVSNVSFGVGLAARSVLNSVFLFHAVEAGLDLAMVNPAHIIPMGEIDPVERELAENLVWNRSEDALEKFINHFESKGPEADEGPAADPTAEMEPEEALHFRILKRKKDGVEADIDRAVEKLGAVPVLNEVLLPAMKEVGDKFGAGELILPFVLQSAEVMKKAVAQLENYLERTADYTKGTVVLATVFGDVHDIGKSLVNTILTNNGYTVVDLGKQVPVGTIIDAAKEHDATAIGLSALLVSTSKQMPLAVQELHREGLKFPVLVGGAAINRNFSYRALHPNGLDDDEVYEGGVFYCKDAFEGLGVMDRMVDQGEHAQMLDEIKAGAIKLRNAAKEEEDLPPLDDTSVRSPVRTDAPVPEPPFWGVREVPVDMDELYHHLDTHVLFKLHWGGRGIKGEAWKKLIEGDPTDPDAEEGFRHRLERMWREQTYLHPRALIGFFPCYADGNDIVVLDPEDRTTEIERFVSPRQQKGARMCTADFFRPGVKQADGTVAPPEQLDVVAVQALTVGDEVTELMAQLEKDGEYAEQLFVHGLGVQTAEGLSEWLHWKVRGWFGIPATQGRRLSWGYPAIPDQSEHEKVKSLLDISQIGMDLTDGYSPTPEQSTLAMIVHHPQAVYYGMRNGRFMENGTPDDVIKDTERDPTRVEASFVEAEVDEQTEGVQDDGAPAAGDVPTPDAAPAG
ncbi:homocysteine S-methyltransferase family protein [Patulibacter sp. SYSU D01012]|uniref:homocysteine S-methyltransferase family protein n=1 Tax=Patulibacter sp. SYSU D01012 TaxID=2817381 RepID=UPI001B30A287|nr:homocysteine S-methyltransferase family protein [Patulibacter sp. SYSU D01012]